MKGLRAFHDERLCGGQRVVDFDPLMHMGVLTCSCGVVIHFSMEEAARGEPFMGCNTCGTPSPEVICRDCRLTRLRVGMIVSVTHDRRLL